MGKKLIKRRDVKEGEGRRKGKAREDEEGKNCNCNKEEEEKHGEKVIEMRRDGKEVKGVRAKERKARAREQGREEK